MSRVAKALRRAGAQAAIDDTWDRSAARADEERQEGQGARGDTQARDGLPWKLHDAASGPDEMRVDRALALRVGPDGLGCHLAALARRLFLAPPVGAGLRTVLFCSADDGGEPTRIATESAHVLAGQTQKRVCLLDTQGHEAAAREPGAPGSADETSQSLVGSTRRMSSNLWIAASPLMVRAMSADVAARHMRELCARFDHVLVDAPPVGGSAEPLVLASLVQGVVLVVDGERTRRDTASHAAAALEAAGARLLGVVLVNQRYPIPTSVYRRL